MIFRGKGKVVCSRWLTRHQPSYYLDFAVSVINHEWDISEKCQKIWYIFNKMDENNHLVCVRCGFQHMSEYVRMCQKFWEAVVSMSVSLDNLKDLDMEDINIVSANLTYLRQVYVYENFWTWKL